MEESSNRGRGRPVGSTNKAPQFKHYNPRKWEPWMDSLVLHKIKGLNNSELAEKFEISETHVSNILSTSQAKGIVETVRKDILSKSTVISDRLAGIQDKAVQRMEEFIMDDELFRAKRLSSTGKALEMFKLTSGIKEEKGNITTINNMQQNIIQTNNEKFLDRLATGLEKSNSMRQLHEGIKEAEYVIVDEKQKVG